MLKRSLLWAVTGSGIGVLLWGIFGGTVWIALNPSATFLETIRNLPISIAWTTFWALFVGAVAMPGYIVLFFLWQLLVRRHPRLDSGSRHRLFTSMALALPFAIIIAVSFAKPLGFPFDWAEFARTFPISMLSCWGAVYLPRRIIPALRHNLANFSAPDANAV